MLLVEFKNFPEERSLVGDILMAYGELEFILLMCVSEVLVGEDIPSATRVLFRVKGEAARLFVADAILRPAFQKYGLVDKWITALSAANFCRKVRNQYAHCHWFALEDETKLCFADLDEDAKTNTQDMKLNMRGVDGSLLKKQRDFLAYTIGWLLYLNQQLLLKKGKPIQTSLFVEPKSLAHPPQSL